MSQSILLPSGSPDMLWTGSELLAFSGGQSVGAIYSPCTDSWRATPPSPVALGYGQFSGTGVLVDAGRFFVERTGLAANDPNQWMMTTDGECPPSKPKQSSSAAGTRSAGSIRSGTYGRCTIYRRIFLRT